MTSRRARTGGERSSVTGMAVATAVSRATGFLRTLAVAWALGATALGDAFNVANVAPNMVFQLAAGGVLSSSIVPILTRTTDDADRRSVAGVLYGLVLVVAGCTSLLLAVGAPLLISLLMAGARDQRDYAATAALATTWLRYFAPQVLAYAAGVFGVAVMTIHRRLVLGAAASVATNLLTIAGAVAFVVVQGAPRPDVAAAAPAAVRLLGVAATAGVVVMTALQLWGAHRTEPRLRPTFDLRHPAVRRLGTLAPWVALYVLVNQVGLAAVTALASSVRGGVSAYQWAFTVMQLPHAVVAVSLISAAFPAIAERAASGDDPTPLVVRSVRTIVRLLLPAAGLLAAASTAIGLALVGEDGAGLVRAAVVGFAASLVPFSVFQVATRTSYAFQDTRTPAVVNVAVNVVNVVVDVIAVVATGPGAGRILGLALGHAASYAVGAAALNHRLRRRHSVSMVGAGAGLGVALATTAAVALAAFAVVALVDPSDQRKGLIATALAGVAGALVLATVAIMNRALADNLRLGAG